MTVIFKLAAIAALASLATARPSWTNTNSSCLTDAQALNIVNVYETLISRSVTGADFNATADSILSPTFFTQSNSINAEIGKPASLPPQSSLECVADANKQLEAISIVSPTAFKAIFSAQPPTQGTETLDTFHSCHKIAWRWRGTSPEGLPVRGLTMMSITPDAKIADTFVEYFRPALLNCTV